MRPTIAALPLALGLALAAPALAQDAPPPEPKVNMVIVYGDDKCPESVGDEIVVCPRMDEKERYRIPPILRTSSAPSNVAWSQRVRSIEYVGRSGTASCSPTGAGGWTGCTGQLLAQARGERETDPSIRAGQLIAEERAKRLSTIDADAAETQSRVEEVEKQMEEKRKAEEAPAAKGQSEPPPPPEPK